jgi:3-dehydroquinate dehydratase/shikimate dehydrogenase
VNLVVTIYEETADAAIDAIRALRDEYDMVEVRAERFPFIELDAIRNATPKPIILTYRTDADNRRAEARRSTGDVLAAGIDFIDVEWSENVEITTPERTVLSHHDYDGMRDVEPIFAKMLARNCAHTKLAATPRDFKDNERLLHLLLPTADRRPPTTVIGMSERGIYSRILAPFRGSALTFVAATNIAAPGQLTLERALAIYGRNPQRAEKVFAVAGDPVSHSLSPSIHNQLFREKGVPAAYTIASIARFEEIVDPLLRGEPCGLSVTSPFKDDAYRFAVEQQAEFGENAQHARAVNTLVNIDGRIVADNTDVDGFAAILPRIEHAAILGAGGTARAARVALARAGVPAITMNRSAEKADAPLEALQIYDGDCIINTLPADVDIAIPPCRVYIEAAYGMRPREVDAELRIGGLELLRAQAVRQHELFMKVFHEL